MTASPLPPSFPATAPYWAAAARGVLALPFCPECAAVRWYPEPACHACATLVEPRWEDLAGGAVLVTWTRVHRPFVPDLDVPYLVGLLSPDEAPTARIVAGLATAGGDPVIGARYRVAFPEPPRPTFIPEEKP